MFKITRFGYDVYELAYDLGSGDMIETHSDIKVKESFNTEEDALKYVCDYLKTRYKKNDWCYEEDIEPDCDMWVLHNIVDKDMKWANNKMIGKFRKNELELFDLLVNVKVEKEEEK